MKCDKVCFNGYRKEDCPKRRLENERLMFGLLLVLVIGMVVLWHI